MNACKNVGIVPRQVASCIWLLNGLPRPHRLDRVAAERLPNVAPPWDSGLVRITTSEVVQDQQCVYLKPNIIVRNPA